MLQRLDLPFTKEEGMFTVTPPFERTDITIPEDLIEEVGRIIGYDKLPAAELPATIGVPDQSRFRGIERMKDMLVEQGFTEVSTQSFAKKGDVYLANPLDKTMPALRVNLEENLKGALERAKQYAPLVLPPNEKPKLFEVGTVFPKVGEYMELRMTERVKEWGESAGISDNLSVAKLEDYGKDYSPKRYELGPYKPFSLYPFISRDIAIWMPVRNSTDDYQKIYEIFFREGTSLLVEGAFSPKQPIDTYEKGDRKSVAFRLVFQSFERTLTDEEVNKIMQKITSEIDKVSDFQVR